MWIQIYIQNSTEQAVVKKYPHVANPANDSPYVTCTLNSGLGNHFFMFFAAFAYALEHGLPVSLPKTCSDGKQTYYDTIFRSLKKYVYMDSLKILPQYRQILYQNGSVDSEQYCFGHKTLPPPNSKVKEITLRGYFQHPEYTAKHWDTIKSLFDIRSLQTQSHEAISVHFRLGDYEQLRHIYPRMTTQYYVRAINHIVEATGKDDWQLHFALQEKTTDKIQSTLSALSNAFPRMELVRIPNAKADWEQLLHMSCCRHNVIANSTFSFMAAKFNYHDDAVVVCPNHWCSLGEMVTPKKWHRCQI